MPTLTLVTSVLNGMPYLAEAFASIGETADGAIEHLVVDAGSSDGTVAFLRERRDLRLIERPGMPLYDAWNLAVAEARGDFIGFLNADDLLGPGGAAEIVTQLAANLSVDVLCGDAEAFLQTPQSKPRALRYHYDDLAVTGLSLDTFLFGAPIINAKFFRRSLFDRLGGFRTYLSIAADRDFLLRLLLSGPAVDWHHVPRLLYRYRIHEGSQTLSNSVRQRLRIADEHQRMVARLLELPGLDRGTASAMRALAAREGLVASLCRAKAGRVGEMLAGFSRLVVSDPWFFTRLPTARAAVEIFRRAVSVE